MDFGKDESETKKTYELSNGNLLYAKRHDPFGFWSLNLDKGQLPEEFQGLYTDVDALQLDVERYQTYRKMAVEEIKPEVKQVKKA